MSKGNTATLKPQKRANIVTTLELRFKVLYDHAYYKFNTDFYKYTSSWCSAIHVPYVHVIMNKILVIILYLIMLARYDKKICMSNLWNVFLSNILYCMISKATFKPTFFHTKQILFSNLLHVPPTKQIAFGDMPSIWTVWDD